MRITVWHLVVIVGAAAAIFEATLATVRASVGHAGLVGGFATGGAVAWLGTSLVFRLESRPALAAVVFASVFGAIFVAIFLWWMASLGAIVGVGLAWWPHCASPLSEEARSRRADRSASSR